MCKTIRQGLNGITAAFISPCSPWSALEGIWTKCLSTSQQSRKHNMPPLSRSTAQTRYTHSFRLEHLLKLMNRNTSVRVSLSKALPIRLQVFISSLLRFASGHQDLRGTWTAQDCFTSQKQNENHHKAFESSPLKQCSTIMFVIVHCCNQHSVFSNSKMNCEPHLPKLQVHPCSCTSVSSMH